MKRNKQVKTNLNGVELRQLDKVNKIHFNNLPLATISRILINEALLKYKVKK
jgi:hypothetical protein